MKRVGIIFLYLGNKIYHLFLEQETDGELKKRILIEAALESYEKSKAHRMEKGRHTRDKSPKQDFNLKTWQNLAISTYGLVGGKIIFVFINV